MEREWAMRKVLFFLGIYQVICGWFVGLFKLAWHGDLYQWAAGEDT